MINSNLSDYLVKSKYSRVLQTALLYQQNMLILSSKRGGFEPRKPPLGCTTDALHHMMYCSHKLTRLCYRHPLRNLNLTISVADHSVPEDLAEFIPQWSKVPSGCKLPHKQWVQLNRLRSQSGQFADDMQRWGLSKTSACDCGSEVQTYTHVPHRTGVFQ